MPKLDALKLDNFKLDGAVGRPFVSIQYGSIDINSAVTTGTATINQVDVGKAVLIPLGCTNSHASFSELAYLELTDDTTVTATMRSTGSASYHTIVNFVVIELNGIKSIQQGTITGTTSAVNTDTVNEVDVDKSWLINLGFSGSSSVADMWRLELTDSTTITATKVGTHNTSIIAYMLVEFE